MENEISHLKLEEIVPNQYQPREVFDELSLTELSKSIQQHGVIQPIIVRRKDDKYEIIDGERRYKAAIMAGLTKIPVIVRNYTDNESVRIALVDNLQRQDFSPIEEAKMYRRILETEGMTQEELANNIGKSQSAIANKLRLLNLPMEVQESLLNQEISERHARSLLTIKDTSQQIMMLKKIIEKRMTVRELDSEIKNMSNMFIPEEFSNNVEDNNSLANNSFTNVIENTSNNFINYNNMNENVGTNVSQDNQFAMPNDSFNNQNYLNENNVQPENNFVPPINNDLSSNNAAGSNPFLTSNNYNPPVAPVDNSNIINPFSSIRMNTNNLNNMPFFAENNSQNNETNNQNAFIGDNSESNSFNIDDYKLPGVEYNEPVENNKVNAFNVNTSNNGAKVNQENVQGYKYVEDNPNYVSVDKPQGVSSIDDVINILKDTLNRIKNGKLRIDTEEIDFDDLYQITIRIDKKGDF